MTETSDWVEETGSVETVEFTDDDWTLALRLDGELTQISGGNWIGDPNWRGEPSATTTWKATVRETLGLEDWQRSEAFIYYDGSMLLRGEFHNPTTTESAGETQIEGKDIIRKLERGGAEASFESTRVDDAISDYADDNLDDWVVTVHEIVPETIDEDLVVQSPETDGEFGDVFDIPDDFPAEIDNGIPGFQTCFNLDGFDDRHDDSTDDFFQSSDYSGTSPDPEAGGALRLEAVDDIGVYEVEIPYTIREADLGLWIRDVTDEDGRPEIEYTFDGQHFATLSGSDTSPGTSLNWGDMAAGRFGNDSWETQNLGDIEPGTYQFKIECTDTSGFSGWYDIDRIAVVDNSYPYNFDNSVTWTGEENALDGPELYPDEAGLVSEPFDQAFNVSAASLTTSWNSTDGDQRIDVSNDGGNTWEGAANAEVITEDFDTFGTTIRSRLTFSRFEADGTADTTPRFGYSGHHVTSYELAIDTDDLPVIDEEEFVGSHWQNLQRLLRRGGMVAVPEYDPEELRMDVLEPGSVEKPVDWTVLDWTRDPDTTDYANAITVFGAVDEETGDRLIATARSESEIESVGEFESEPIFEDDVSNKEELRNIARRELATLLAEGTMKGSLSIVPKPTRPGFGYPVDQLDGDVLPLWATEFDLTGNRGSLEFGEPDDLASGFVDIRTQVIEDRA